MKIFGTSLLDRIVYFDIDNTLFDFTLRLNELLQKDYPDANLEKIDCYGGTVLDCQLTMQQIYDKYLSQEGFFEGMNPYDGAVELVNSINRVNNNIYFISTMVTMNAWVEKARLLRKHFPWFNFEKQLISASNKHLLINRQDLIFEDNPVIVENLYKRREVSVDFPVILKSQPWNSHVEYMCSGVIKDWKEGLNESKRFYKWC